MAAFVHFAVQFLFEIAALKRLRKITNERCDGPRHSVRCFSKFGAVPTVVFGQTCSQCALSLTNVKRLRRCWVKAYQKVYKSIRRSRYVLIERNVGHLGNVDGLNS